MGAGRGSAVWGAGLAWAVVPDSGAGWEQDEARGMQCGHGVSELCLDVGLGLDVRALALPIN